MRRSARGGEGVRRGRPFSAVCRALPRREHVECSAVAYGVWWDAWRPPQSVPFWVSKQVWGAAAAGGENGERHVLHFILMYRESEIQLRIARSTRSTRRIPRTRCSLRRGSRTRGSCVTDGQRRGGPGSTLAFADAVGVLGSVAFPTGGARGARGGVLRSGRVVF